MRLDIGKQGCNFGVIAHPPVTVACPHQSVIEVLLMRFSILSCLSLLLALFLWTPAPTYAAACDQPQDICDDIDDIAEAWAAVADALEETADEDLDDLDVPRLEKDVNELLEPSNLLGEALIELGNDDEVEMGDLLLDVLEELYDVEGDDFAAYLVDRIDDIVDIMDFIVEYCDDAGK